MEWFNNRSKLDFIFIQSTILFHLTPISVDYIHNLKQCSPDPLVYIVWINEIQLNEKRQINYLKWINRMVPVMQMKQRPVCDTVQ